MSTVSPKGYQEDAVNNALELFRPYRKPITTSTR
jgi:hypothetical protein